MIKPYLLHIIHNSGVCLFSFNFKENLDVLPHDLFSAFITAISTFSAELNTKFGYSKEYGRLDSIPVNKTFEIIISYKDILIGTFIVDKKNIDDDLKKFLGDLLNEFLLKFENLFKNWDNDVEIFQSFEHEIERIYKKAEILSYQVPKTFLKEEENIQIDDNYLELLKNIDGESSLEDISKKMDLDFELLKTLISNLLWREIISLSQKVYDDDIYEPRKELFYLVRTKHLESGRIKDNISSEKAMEFKLLESIDGFKTLYDLSEEFNDINILEIKHIISYYLSKGSYLEKVELFPQIITINEKALKKIKSEKLALAYSLENICDGELSLVDISKKIGAPIRQIKEILDLFGKYVIYKKKYLR